MSEILPENVVENALNGERFVFHHDRASAAVLPFSFTVKPGGGVPTRHYHLNQHETFSCVSGELTITLVDGEKVLRAGDSAELPPGTVHSLINRGTTDVVCEVEYRPAGRNEDWLKIATAIARKSGKEPGLLDIAPFISDVGMYIEGPPVWVQRALFALLKGIALVLGKRSAGLAAASELYGRPFQW